MREQGESLSDVVWVPMYSGRLSLIMTRSD
jgi:hypothetical protein